MNDTIDRKTGEILEPTGPWQSIDIARSMPKEIVKAVVAVLKEIKQIGYDDENKFQRYNYVSIDKFLAFVGPKLADAGLVVTIEETDHNIRVGKNQDGKDSAWLEIGFEIMLHHESGASYGPLHRHLAVPATGAQAWGSAQSYVLKQFLRALFFIPTGEKDADASDQPGMVANRTPPPAQRPQERPSPTPAQDEQGAYQATAAEPRKGPPGLSKEEHAKYEALYNEIRREIVAARTYYDVSAIGTKRDTDIRSLEAVGFSAAASKLRESMEARKKQLQPESGVPEGYRKSDEAMPT